MPGCLLTPDAHRARKFSAVLGACGHRAAVLDRVVSFPWGGAAAAAAAAHLLAKHLYLDVSQVGVKCHTLRGKP